jgi:hypothetical protein
MMGSATGDSYGGNPADLKPVVEADSFWGDNLGPKKSISDGQIQLVDSKRYDDLDDSTEDLEDSTEDSDEFTEDSDEFTEDSDEFGEDSAEISGSSRKLSLEETTDEYNMNRAFERAAARSRVAGEEGPPLRDQTRELALPRDVRPSKRDQIPEHVRAQWEAQPRIASRIKLWIYSEPVVLWYYHLPQRIRRLIRTATWMVVAAGTMVGVFAISAMAVYPSVEEYVRPMFAPRPEEPIRFSPRRGAVFDLVEERDLNADKFRYATDCIWMTRDQDTDWEFIPGGLDLMKDGESVAALDVRYNWDGLLRFYFRAGKIPVGEDVYLQMSLVGGGLWADKTTAHYSLFSQGGRIPARVAVGPVRFID